MYNEIKGTLPLSSSATLCQPSRMLSPRKVSISLLPSLSTTPPSTMLNIYTASLTPLPQFASRSLQSHGNSTSHSADKHAADLVSTSSTSEHGSLGRIHARSSCEAAVWFDGRCSVRWVSWRRCRRSVCWRGFGAWWARGVEDC